jgi:hypothetical protein
MTITRPSIELLSEAVVAGYVHELTGGRRAHARGSGAPQRPISTVNGVSPLRRVGPSRKRPLAPR